MKIFGCDIGCKNFAYCIIEINDTIERPIKILHWEVLNICSSDCLCCKTLRNKKQCATKAVYFDKETGCKYCSKHKPVDVKLTKLKADEKDNLYSYGVNMYDELDKRPFILECDSFVIENQPNTLNQSMKSISMILYSYFIQHRKEAHFINAGMKVKLNEDIAKKYITKDKKKYAITKKLGIGICKFILNYDVSNYLDFIEYFNNHKKQDDLCDAFLHAVVSYYKVNYYKDNKEMEKYIEDFMK